MARSFRRVLYKITHPVLRFLNKTFMPITSGSRAILIREDKVLLVKNIGLDYWSLPGGGLEKNEDPEVCLIREVEEELKIKIDKTEYKLGEYCAKAEGKRDTVYIFVANSPTFEFKKQWEIDDAEWFTWENLPDTLSPATNRRIKEYLKGERGVKTTW